MNRITSKSRIVTLQAVAAAALTLVAAGANAQDTTTTSVRHGDSTFETKVRNAEIVYVEGNDLVLKLEDGKVEHMIVPFSEKFQIDGREVTVSELKAGTKLTQTITTTSTPHYVKTVRTLKGKVLHVNAPGSVILQLPDYSTQLYKVPSHATFNINGKQKTVFELKKGMRMEATIVTDEPRTVIDYAKLNVGQAPIPQTPQLLGVLLIQRVNPPAEEVASNVTAEHVDPATLPETASSQPLAALLGLIGIGSSLGLASLRKFAKVIA